MTTTSFPDRDASLFLRIAAQGAVISTHAQLWRWLEGDLRAWLAHDALLVGWGDFHAGALHQDIVSSVPGLRTRDLAGADIAPLLRYLRDCWIAAQEAPCEVSLAGIGQLLRDCPAATRDAMGNMRTALVHGIREGAGGCDRIFAALSRGPGFPEGSASMLKLLLPYIDTALRRVPPMAARLEDFDPGLGDHRLHRSGELSDRERQIMQWVALGKTNPEIGCILSISEFTVKNHMKSIFAKLDVTNRAQAVAKLSRPDAYA